MMRLKYFPVNAAWGFIFGKHISTASHIGMGADNRKLFPSRAQAVAAAREAGLKVGRRGLVSTIRKENPRRRANPHRRRRVRRTLRESMHVRAGARGLTTREARRLAQFERRYDRLVGRSPNPRRRKRNPGALDEVKEFMKRERTKRKAVRLLTRRKPPRRSRHPSGGSGGGGFTVEHFPQYRHPFVVCRPDGSRYQAFNTRMQAAAAAALLNQQKPPRRSRNPRSPLFKLLAQRHGGKRLVYLGGVKFAEKGRPVYFKTPAGARTVAKLLRLQFPMLKRYAFAVAGA
jgi:hypothetical protein